MRTSEKTYRNECQEGHVEPAKTLRAVNSIDLGRSYMKYLSGFVSKAKKIITPQEGSQAGADLGGGCRGCAPPPHS